jgi:methylmalonyl-CoA mutase C-terminal domain/subunit
MSEERRIRVVTAMPGLDVHDRGLIYISDILSKAGMEVIYLGKFNTPEEIVETAIQEDADVIALSYLNDHLYMVYYPEIMELLKKNKAEDICVVAGGRIDEADKHKLLEMGIKGLFEHGTSDEEMINCIREVVKDVRQKE